MPLTMVTAQRDHSMLTFETSAISGAASIIERLTVSRHPWEDLLSLAEKDASPLQNLPFGKIVHQLATLDAQPSTESGGILVLVTGALLVRITSST